MDGDGDQERQGLQGEMYSQVPNFPSPSEGGEGVGVRKKNHGSGPTLLLQATKLGNETTCRCCFVFGRSRLLLALPASAARTASTGALAGLAGGLSRSPNADLGITSGARQGMKGDPRGPFTSASYCPVPHQRPAAMGLGLGKED